MAYRELICLPVVEARATGKQITLTAVHVPRLETTAPTAADVVDVVDDRGQVELTVWVDGACERIRFDDDSAQMLVDQAQCQ